MIRAGDRVTYSRKYKKLLLVGAKRQVFKVVAVQRFEILDKKKPIFDRFTVLDKENKTRVFYSGDVIFLYRPRKYKRTREDYAAAAGYFFRPFPRILS